MTARVSTSSGIPSAPWTTTAIQLLRKRLAGQLYVLGLLLSVPVQAALLRFRSEPRASLVGR